MKTLALVSALLFSISSFAQEGGESSDETQARQDATEQKGHRHKGKRGGKGKRMMENIDINKDGKIDLSEYLSNAEQRFQAMDQDDNGYVTAEEVRSFGDQLREKHRAARKEARQAYQESLQESKSE